MLAIEGGEPVRTEPFPPWPLFEDDEIEAVEKVLRSGRVNYRTGPEGRAFEKEFADFVGVSHAVALANGTLALEAALQALGIGAGDEVVVPTRTFIATASAVVARGATPVVADVDRDSQNVTASTIEAVLTERTAAVIVVHLAGMPCDMDPILELAARRGLKVIEDCAQALAASYKGRPIGSMGDAGAFSFCQDKIMTTAGEGGMLVTNDETLWKRVWSHRDHGKDYDLDRKAAATPGAEFRWVHTSFGTNWRMTEMQSAQGRVALQKVPGWVERRRANAEILRAGMRDIEALRVLWPSEDEYHAFYKFYAFVRPERLVGGWDRKRIAEAIAAEGVPCYTGSCSEIYLEVAFEGLETRPIERLPVAKELGETSLMFLVHPTTSVLEMNDTVAAVRKVMGVASARG